MPSHGRKLVRGVCQEWRGSGPGVMGQLTRMHQLPALQDVLLLQQGLCLMMHPPQVLLLLRKEVSEHVGDGEGSLHSANSRCCDKCRASLVWHCVWQWWMSQRQEVVHKPAGQLRVYWHRQQSRHALGSGSYIMRAGGDDRNGATSAHRQNPGTAQADVTSPAASSVAAATGRHQAAGQEAQQQFRSTGMPLGAVDMSRAGASAPSLADDGADGAVSGVVSLCHGQLLMHLRYRHCRNALTTSHHITGQAVHMAADVQFDCRTAIRCIGASQAQCTLKSSTSLHHHVKMINNSSDAACAATSRQACPV